MNEVNTMKEIVTENEQQQGNDDDMSSLLEEAHYFHTINALVELIVLYGQDKVMHDLKLAIGWKKT